MKKNRNKYTLTDFIEDESFVSFILDKNEKDKKIWMEWVNSNPPNKHEAEQAKILLTAMKTQGNRPAPVSKAEEFDKLLNRINHFRLIGSKFSERSLYNWLKIAVTIVIFLSIGLSYFIFSPTIKSKNSIVYNQAIVPKGSRTKLVLEDGTTVWLNAESILKYPSHFSKSSRKVELIGEAYFNVTKSNCRPFVVNTSDIRINVMGTSFNVKAYPHEDVIETTLESGLVSIEKINTENRSGEKITLKPKQKLVLQKSMLDMQIVELTNIQDGRLQNEPVTNNQDSIGGLYKNIDTELYTSWKDGKLIFKNERLDVLAKRLEKWYDLDIRIADEPLKAKTYTGTFENETVEQAIKAICLTSGMQFTIDKNNITIYK